MKATKDIAVVGGGLAGLSSAYQLLKADPSVRLTVYEKGASESYADGRDDSHRSSLSASPARTIRITGSEDKKLQWAIHETMSMVRDIEADMAANPAAYASLADKTLFHPEVTVTVARNTAAKLYRTTLATLAGAGVPYSELDGKALKARFPGLFDAAADDSRAIVEEISSPRNVSGSLHTSSLLQALRIYLSRRGAALLDKETVGAVDEAGGKALLKSSPSGARMFDAAVVAPGQWIESALNTQKYGIKARHDRMVVMDIDMKALRPQLKTIPYAKFDKNGAEESFYSFQPESDCGHVKFFPESTRRKNTPFKELHAPISDKEKHSALKSAAARFGIAPDTLAPHVKWSSCVYTYPKEKSNPLIAALSDRIVVNGLDSSSAARKSGGFGKIAAHLALGLPEPVKGAYEAYGLEAHYALVGAPKTEKPVEKPGFWKRVKIAIHDGWHGFLSLIGFRNIEELTEYDHLKPKKAAAASAAAERDDQPPARQWVQSVSGPGVETRSM